MKILKLSNGTNIQIEEYEVKDVLDGVQNKETKVFKNGVANLIYFVALVDKVDEIWNKKNQKTGILHDGTSVIRHFGRWYLDSHFDEKGNPTVSVDPAYYQEVNRDCVFSPKEYNEIRHLPREKRLELILQGSGRQQLRSGGQSGFKKIK